MSNLVAFPDARKAREEAALWLAGLDRGLTDGERTDLRGWLRDPLNNKAFLEMGKLWRGLDAIAVLSELFPLSQEVLNPQPRRSFTAVVVAAVAAACIAVASTLMLSGDSPWSIMAKRQVPPPPVFSYTYRTAMGETRVAKLADGSTVTLNTGTRIVVFYSPGSRDVYLQYGEVRFDVARENRPFNVRVGSRVMQAVGTTFNVRMLSQESAELTVTQGKVKVIYESPHPSDSPARLRDQILHGETIVNAQEAATVEPGLQTVRKLDVTEIESRLAWQQGLLYFQGDSLERVLAEMNRYTTTRFVIADEALREARVGGYFRAGDVDGLLEALRVNFLIDSRRDEQGRVLLTSIPPPQ
jgi:transmembrane sensor